MEKVLLFRTVHGSRLYGLHHADSDFDFFEVYGYAKGKAKQNITGKDDRTKMSLDRFLNGCHKGVPQFLEAMFSQQADVDEMGFLRSQYFPSMPNVRETYERTIKSFWMEGSHKRKRHAMRLVLNLRSMQECGRFNPTLTPEQREFVEYYALQDERPETYE